MAIKSLNNKMLNVAYLEGAESIVISGGGGGGSDVQIINQSKSVTITENGTTSVTYDSGYTGLSEVNIDVNVASSGGSGDSPFSWDWTQIGYTPENTVLQQQFEDDIAYSKSLAETFTPSKATSHFKNQRRLKFVPMVDTSNVTNMSYMFNGCSSLTTIPQLDTSSVTNMNSMFNGCSSLTAIPQLDTSNVTSMGNMFSSCYTLTFILIKNIGKSTLATFDFSGASKWGTDGDENRQSLIDSLITYSYDRATNGMASATINLSTTTKALLTEGEIAQITAKGFTIS